MLELRNVREPWFVARTVGGWILRDRASAYDIRIRKSAPQCPDGL